ncbi:MAG: LysE family transporter [Polaribacter sp.]|uniref:LysE family transporter n=1 Tax=Polaribacter sp. TaxID=1920175 RepID=UPI002F34F6C7
MITIFFIGFLFSFLGYTPPGVLNMTALKISLRGNKKDFKQFTLGVSLVVFIQAFLSIYLTEYIFKNPMFLELLEKVGIIVLFFLSIFFYGQNKKEKKQVEIDNKKKHSFFSGIILSALNMFSIPFFCGIVAFLMAFNLIKFDTTSTFIFVLGSVIGAYLILFLYGKYAANIQKKNRKFNK